MQLYQEKNGRTCVCMYTPIHYHSPCGHLSPIFSYTVEPLSKNAPEMRTPFFSPQRTVFYALLTREKRTPL